jgi:single-strand DNA-binding protein
MATLNKVILIGNIGKDPEVRYLEGGIAIAKFPMATKEIFTDKNGQKNEHTDWHHIVMWKNLAERAEKNLKKGKQIYVEGKIRSRSWEDKEGNSRHITEIIADNFFILGRKEDSINETQNDTSI